MTVPAIDRRAVMQNAHRIARQARPYMANYREALAYGLKAAWDQLKVAQSFAAVRVRVQPRTLTADQIVASRAATRRCGSSYMYA
jgi:hypothetical protein